jgi:hypothetical protein
MKKYFTINVLVLLFAVVAVAQSDVSRYEAFLGFQYVRANQFNQKHGTRNSHRWLFHVRR